MLNVERASVHVRDRVSRTAAQGRTRCGAILAGTSFPTFTLPKFSADGVTSSDSRTPVGVGVGVGVAVEVGVAVGVGVVVGDADELGVAVVGVAKSGFGLLEKSCLRWFDQEGAFLGSILSKASKSANRFSQSRPFPHIVKSAPDFSLSV